jgi:molecular chaperone GrpE
MKKNNNPETNLEEQVELLTAQLAEAKQSAADNLLGWQRALADYQNLKKEWQVKQAALLVEAKLNILRDLLPILDMLERVTEDAPATGNSWLIGLKHLNTQIAGLIASWGVARLATVGNTFDPNIHEAVENKGSGSIIIKEISPGYQLSGKLIYPAKVVVGDNEGGQAEIVDSDEK